MLRFAANLTYLFTELPMLDRFAAAAEAGFKGVEIPYPYDIDPRDLTRTARAFNMDMILLNCPPPNWGGGPRGFAAVPGLEARFRKDFDHALRVAQRLNVRHIHVLAGKAKGEQARQTFIENLRWATERAPHANLAIKPLSSPSGAFAENFLNNYQQASDIISEIGSGNLGIQFDTFHAQSLTRDVIGTWRRYADQIRHVQIAGYPKRDEPFAGSINFPNLFEELDRYGYQGWVGARYTPATRTDLGLGWMPKIATA
ncbi:TIM barrel protein [Paracoccus sp. 11-3]|uniref:TIM barrel protein n=1 Tax=Paracoccus amoyensis TaxID=2760093 RepID=A0A926GER4_9RHOB|nr:TIM barrel protein [Paracoccus amoyensis]MBC9246014.1 TIM barrel protein [Paracoccus amoyensis]